MPDAAEIVEFKLPDVGEGIDGAEIVTWLVAVGDQVSEHQSMVEVETDKAIVVVPSPVDGSVEEICFAEGERPAVGDVIIRLAPAGKSRLATAVDPTTSVEPPTAVDATAPPPAGPPVDSPPPIAVDPSPTRRPLASPATRKLARELAVDLALVSGSGRAGRISQEDVEFHVAAGAPAALDRRPDPVVAAAGEPAATTDAGPRPGETIPLRGIRRAIASRLTQAWREVPHVIDYREVDAGALMSARASLKERARSRGDDQLAGALSITPVMIKLACEAIADHPFVNSTIDMEAEEIRLHDQVHVGIATATPEGLVVPVLRDAARKSIGEIALETVELASAARERRLRPDQMQGATFTVNNFGRLGIWLGTPIVTPPQVANLGIGRLEERATVRDGEVTVRPIFALSVSADHRVLDGSTLAAFVSDVCGLFENPSLLLERVR